MHGDRGSRAASVQTERRRVAGDLPDNVAALTLE